MKFESAMDRVAGSNDSHKAKRAVNVFRNMLRKNNRIAIRHGIAPFKPTKPAMRSVVNLFERQARLKAAS